MTDAAIPDGYSHEDGVYWERKRGGTPSGGDYSEILFIDETGCLVSPEMARSCVVRECMSDGTLIKETSGLL